MLVSKEVFAGDCILIGFGLLAGLLAWSGAGEKRRTRGGGDERRTRGGGDERWGVTLTINDQFCDTPPYTRNANMTAITTRPRLSDGSTRRREVAWRH